MRVLVEKRRRDAVQIIAFGPEVVVYDVEQHRKTVRVRRRDEVLEIVGRSVAGIGRIEHHAVVAPISRAGKRRDRHQFDRGDAERNEFLELPAGGFIRAFKGERADVQLVHDVLVPGPSAPAVIRPGERRSDDRARRMHAVGLEARSGIGDRHAPVDRERVARTRARICIVDVKPGPALLHREHAAVDVHVDAVRNRGIEPQPVAALERERPVAAGEPGRHEDAATSERSKMRVNSAYKSRIRSGRACAP